MADAVALEETVSVAVRLALELSHDESLEALDVLMGRARHLKERRRHGGLVTCRRDEERRTSSPEERLGFLFRPSLRKQSFCCGKICP